LDGSLAELFEKIVHGGKSPASVPGECVVLPCRPCGRFHEARLDKSCETQPGEKGVKCAFGKSEARDCGQGFYEFITVALTMLESTEDADIEESFSDLDHPIIEEGIHERERGRRWTSRNIAECSTL
jgi:hypothetical protein